MKEMMSLLAKTSNKTQLNGEREEWKEEIWWNFHKKCEWMNE